MSTPETAFEALERAYADAVRTISALPAGRRMDAAGRLAEIAERHLGTAARIQQEEALGSHSAHPLNFAALARSQLRAARQKRGSSLDEFAEMLSTLIGWRVVPDVLRAWEGPGGVSPPSDVLLVAQQLLRLSGTA